MSLTIEQNKLKSCLDALKNTDYLGAIKEILQLQFNVNNVGLDLDVSVNNSGLCWEDWEEFVESLHCSNSKKINLKARPVHFGKFDLEFHFDDSSMFALIYQKTKIVLDINGSILP